MRVIRDPGDAFQPGCVVVPTMGSLHEGHASLIRIASDRASARRARCVVTIFVNPTQFNVAADFAKYPRDEGPDLDMCESCGATDAFIPTPETVYPPGEEIQVGPLPRVATEPKLEDRGRPGHFEGVVQVVRRLFRLTGASGAVFGEKDWQQLQVAWAMSSDEALGVEIIPGPIVREADGLAMSSRNVHLDPAARSQALALKRSLEAAGREPTPSDAENAMRRTLAGAGLEPDYAAVRDARTLMECPDGPGPEGWRALVCALVGGVRLLDNAPWTPG